MATGLPIEIWLSILQDIAAKAAIPPETHLFPYDRKGADPVQARRALNDLFSLCLVSRQLGRTAQGLLYREISIGYLSENLPSGYCKGRLASLVTTLTTRRDLADLVQRAFIHGDLLWALTGEEINSIAHQAGRVLGFIPRSDFLGPQISSTNGSRYDWSDLLPISFLIFCLMRNLESIIIFPLMFRDLPDWFPPPTGGCRFPRLKSFEAVACNEGVLLYGCPSNFFWHRNMNQLLGSRCPARTVTLYTTSHLCDILWSFPQLEHLCILALSMQWSSLRAPAHFAGLRSFRYYKHFDEMDGLLNSLEAISSSSSATIRELAINLDFLYSLPPSVSVLPTKSFSNLETLVIRDRNWTRSWRDPRSRISMRAPEAPCIFSAESLPPSARRVFLIFREESVALAIKDELILGLLHAAQSGRLPQLRQVYFYLGDATPQGSDDIIHGLELREVYGEAGVGRPFGDIGVDFRVLREDFARKQYGWLY
ncbi:hypothetical protein QBC34DRAFT_59548 [Podospora aff. communis PSN243]|uniref:F-box domain-containing protein n=1 Tax=Podospora aff. communis PSN243 TaxID=3040156 RepID=A0AAV9GSD4_9PEZI|nr:hypothetical protein QBC34DRAFT_59548 [Podospora aff. communis PSN243]